MEVASWRVRNGKQLASCLKRWPVKPERSGARNAQKIIRKPKSKELLYITSTHPENLTVRYYKFQAYTAATLFIVFATVSMSALWLRLHA